MLVVLVDILVNEGMRDAFMAATLDNVAQSRNEPQIAAFDLLGDPTNPLHFMLIEVYRTADAPAAHKTTEHYQRWRVKVEPMMQVPRRSTQWSTLDAGYR